MIAIPIDKPKGCYYCPLEQLSECGLLDNKFVEEIDPNDCPLIEIVTCGECKWCKDYDNGCWCRRHCNQREKTDFCSDGVRRANETD